ncbi:HK97 family phage prohead protease [Geothrix campi]|uniref:HK97 family phage prohead protease n=1 Tax=Geothrix campi TaxID=2966450 RepID=UPI002148AECE|nr:HK97 family phage prohead protease [Geothrix sp. SG10]
MTKKFKLYGEFEKVEEQEDGTLKVSGIASSEAVDSDGETITAEAMKAAIPDYMAFGALREMHTAWAAGTALKCDVGDDRKTHFEALVVDAEAIKKVQTGTYKGFSIGGKVTKRDPANRSTITGIKLVEVSLVDRPANPEAVFSMGKVEGDESEALTLAVLRKSMWSIADFAGLLQSLAFVAWDSAYEAECEGDASPIPAALGAWIEQGLGILQAMTAEECAELMSQLPSREPQALLEMAAKVAGVDLAKAGKKFSKSTAEALSGVHKMLQDAEKAMGGLGFDQPANVEDKEEEADKAAAAEALQKAAGLETDLAKAQDELTKAQARITELEAMPEVAKGVAVVFDAEKQAEMFAKQAKDAEAEDLKKYQETTDPEEKFKASIKFIHKYGHKPE